MGNVSEIAEPERAGEPSGPESTDDPGQRCRRRARGEERGPGLRHILIDAEENGYPAQRVCGDGRDAGRVRADAPKRPGG